MASPVKPIPEGIRTITPHLSVKGAARMIEFYKRALGAIEKSRFAMPDGSVGHAELRIGDSSFYLSDESPQSTAHSPGGIGGASVVLHLFVENADALFERAVKAGATVKVPIMDAFWGDRYGQFADPAGHVWAVATHKEDVRPEDMATRMEEMNQRMKEWMATTGKS